MKCIRSKQRPLGATMVEVAVTAPVAFLLIIGLMVGLLGTFRYQQVANLAREGAQYASMHGPYYQKRTGKSMVTTEELVNDVIRPFAAGLDPDAIHCDLQFDTEANTVTVNLSYDWLPEGFLPATTLSSTSVMPIEQ